MTVSIFSHGTLRTSREAKRNDHQRLWRLCRRQAARADRHRAPGARSERRPDRHRLLRRLPFGSPHGALRMGRNALSVRPGPRDRRPCQRGRRGGRRVQGRRHGRRRLPGRQLPALPRLRGRARAILRGRLHGDLQLRRPPTRRAIRSAAMRERIVVDEKFVLQHPPSRGAARRGRAPALRRHHHLFAAAPLERRARQEGRHRRHRRARPYGRQARPRDGRPHRRLHHLREQAAGRARRSARTRWWCRGTRRR